MGATKGKEIVLLWRRLSQKSKETAKLMIYETEHEVKLSADSEVVKTKHANISTSSTTDEEVTFTSYTDSKDSIYDYLEEAMQKGETLELWEVDLSDNSKKPKYPAKYRQGKLSEITAKAAEEGLLEISGTFKTDYTRQKGEATFTADQLEAIAYKFADTTQA